jgi:hypothetical protein
MNTHYPHDSGIRPYIFRLRCILYTRSPEKNISPSVELAHYYYVRNHVVRRMYPLLILS